MAELPGHRLDPEEPMTFSRTASRALAAMAVTATAAVLPAANTASAEPVSCPQWTRHTVAAGYGILENLGFDGRGNLLLAEQSATGSTGSLQRLGADGARSVAVDGIDGPGAILVVGDTAYFTTGNTATAALSGRTDGTIGALHLTDGTVTTVATGLTMPNGLAQLPNGDFVVSRDIGAGTLTRVTADNIATPYAPSLSSTNGLAFDRQRHRLIVSTTFDPTSVVAAVDYADPDSPPRQAVIPGAGPLNSADDLTVGPDGKVYVALNVAGSIQQVDVDTGQTCAIATGLPLSSSARFGSGPGWDPNALYVTSFLGTVTKLTPP
ncbi:SMP-30/gluconolactonase/LRE family protein [Nocardia salmonicida]|uniref:SMP-30/gluconolactonase/LRE family protein n=1 Tax=Nocardia salmonicida TaxID=53431 RepID=UPI003413641E